MAKEIHVLFVDADTGKTFADAMLPPENLPKTFELETTMHLSDVPWSVIKAEPMKAEDFIRTGKLTLTMRKVQTMPIKDILMTLPTIENVFPALTGQSALNDPAIFRMHEDDWRQIEFVHPSLRDKIQSELTSIQRIFAEQRGPNGRGFKTLHIRNQITEPLPQPISLKELTALLPPNATPFQGVSELRQIGLVQGGFAYMLGGLVIYGQQVNGTLKNLGLHTQAKASAPNIPALTASFEQILSRYNLYLVDWCSMLVIGSNSGRMQEYLQTLLGS